MVKPRTVLGFDVGLKRLGVAVGQELTATARPLTVLTQRQGDDWQGLPALVNEWQPDLFVLGIAYPADGTANAVTRRIESFAQALEQRFQRPVAMVDERLSSHEARTRCREQGRSGRHSTPVDDWAAAIIIETWLQQEQSQ